MNATGPARGYQGAYRVTFVLIAVVALRLVLWYRPDLLAPMLFLGIFTLLYALEPWLSRHVEWQRFVYFPLQTVIVIVLANLRPFTDISSAMYILLGLQAMRAFSRRMATAWLIFYAVLMGATLMLGMQWVEGLAIFLLYLAVGGFLISYDFLYSRLQAGQAESQRLLAELRSAHVQLEEFAAQAEELAATRERNRLARELHDSVSQAIFSISLTAQSARILLDREPARVPAQIDRLQSLTGEALAQLRSLIAELRPPHEP